MKLVTDIQQRTSDAIKELYGIEVSPTQIEVKVTNPSHEGDFSIPLFNVAKMVSKLPALVATEIGKYHEALPELKILKTNVINGFLNMSFSDFFWTLTLYEALSQHKHTGKTFLVEFCSPNTNKPLHLGHVRNMLIGDSVSRILQAYGHDVVKMNLYNDRGIHICKSMLGWKKCGNGDTPESTGTKGDHFVVKYYMEFEKMLYPNGPKEPKNAELDAELNQELIKWEAGDKDTIDLWKMMNGWVYEGFTKTYKELGISFDRIDYESKTYTSGKQLIEYGLDNGKFIKNDEGSICVDLTEEDLGKKVLLRADGTSVYTTQDIGTVVERYKNFSNIDKMIYTVGNEQNHHFKALFLILKKLGHPWADKCHHLSYGMVKLPNGRMKTREGNVVDADDLMVEMTAKATEVINSSEKRAEALSEEEIAVLSKTIGLGAMKYHMLKVNPAKDILFNPDESCDIKGDTGPFVQYTHARIVSLLAKAMNEFSSNPTEHKIAFDRDKLSLSDKERKVLRMLYSYPWLIEQAANELDPSLVTAFAYSLAKEYNQFYHETNIMREENNDKKAFLIMMSSIVGITLKSCLRLLGIEAPDRM